MIRHWKRRAILVGLPAVLAGCAAGGPAGPTPTPLPQIVSAEQIVFTVERGPILWQQEYRGEIVPAYQDSLYFGASGAINRVLVQPGETFQQGDVLAELKMDDLLEQLQQAEIDLQVAQQNQAINAAQRAYALQQAESEAVIAQKQVELAQLAVAAAEGDEQAVAQLNLDIAQEQLKTAEARLALVRATVDAPVDQIVQQNQNTVDSLHRQIAERQLIAPYDGVVLKMDIIPGTQATAFAASAVVGDPSRLVVQTAYNFDLVNNVDPSTAAYIYPTREDAPEYPVQFIEGFLPVSNAQSGITRTPGDGAQVNFLYFALPEDLPAEAVQVGQAVRLKVILGSNDDALLVSPAAIRGTDIFSYVIVLEDDYHRRVEVVDIGVKTADKWEVTANLQPGDRLLGP